MKRTIPSPNQLTINLIPGKLAPKYPLAQEVRCEHVNITEQGTEGNLPIVDFVLKGPHGEQYILVLTGRIVLTLASALRGVNERNHEMFEP